jgi:hypothetical protein
MTGQRLDALMARKYTDREGTEKSAFTKIGTAFPTRTGDGYSIVLDAMPAPEAAQNGGMQYRILLMPPKPRDGDAPRQGTADDHANKRGPARDDLDDEIPF